MASKLKEILDSGQAPGLPRVKTPWRRFTSAVHDGNSAEASRIYGSNAEGVLRSKPQYADLLNEN